MYRQCLVIFFLAIAHPLLCYGKVDMAVDPILEYLNLDQNSVIEHELINIDLPRNIHKRSVEDNKFENAHMVTRAFGHDINLWLHPRNSLFASVDTPVYFVNQNPYKPGGVSFDRQEGVMARVGQLYENVDHLASVVIGSDAEADLAAVTADIPLRGDIAGIMIRPLPSHIVEEHLRKRRSIGDSENIALKSARHVALKIKNNVRDHRTSFKKLNVRGDSIGNIVELDYDWYQNPRPINYSNSIYPELFLHHDNTYFNESFWDPQSQDLLRFLEYVLAFWNGVDLSYRHLENPGIRLNIAGISVATSKGATPYIDFNTDNYVKDGDALRQATFFFRRVYRQIPLESYDVAITMTKLTLSPGTLGISYRGGACSVTREIQWGLGLVHDNGGFSGMSPAVHEVAHTLGITHDNNYPDDAQCHHSNGYIMAAIITPTRNSATFSECSLRQFNSALKNGTLWCTYDPPQKKVNLPKLMPGKLQTLDEQCQAEGFAGSYRGPDQVDVCVQLHCIYSMTYATEPVKLPYGAAPGTPCGSPSDVKPRFCLQKQCVSLN